MPDIDVERSVSPTLRTRSAGHTVMQKCLAVQDDTPQRGRLARALGRSPLHPDAAAWYADTLAALETGRRLDALGAVGAVGAGFTVLHSLPIGDEDGLPGADIEHLVIGRSGVFCLNSTLTRSVTAEQLDAVALEARLVSTHLSRTLHRVVPVTPLLVMAGGPEPKAAAGPAPDVELVDSRALAGWFAKRGPVLTTAELATVALAAEQPSTWKIAADVLEEPTAVNDFSDLQSEVDAASDRERVALTVATATAVIVMLASAAVIVSATSGLLQLAGY
jgi:hypothetical protein